jgi:3-hydroxyisobutyrate dehydrogenase
MGHELATNLVARGHDVLTHDLAGPARNPDGATFVPDLAALATRATVVVLSLPDGDASEAVTLALARAPERAVTHVVDTSTVGPDAARAMAARLAAAGIGYVDAPVSGGAAGARARTLTVMVAGSPEHGAAVEDVLAGLSDRRVRIGDEPGMAQAVKLANNFLSATALAATSEAVAFATSAGVDMATVLDVLNASSGQSAATSDKFVNHVMTERYGSGFLNTLMAKDVALYVRAVQRQGSPVTVGQVTATIWSRFAAEEPGADFTRIYPFTKRDSTHR